MIEDLLSNFLHLVLDFVIYIVNILLVPFDFVVSNFMPSYIENSLSYIVNAFGVAFSYIGYVLDSVGFESFTIVLFADYMLFKVMVPLGVSVIKLAIRWYYTIKLGQGVFMLFWIFIILFVCLVLFFIRNKIKIKFNTFFKKGFKVNRGVFGV